MNSWRPARDTLLVVLGAAIAIAADEWRESRQRSGRVKSALAGIAAELKADSARVAAARAKHLWLLDTLQAVQKRKVLPSPEIYTNGMFNPARISNTAWQAARETGALSDMPLDVVLKVAPVYESQERYRELADALGIGIMNDVRRDGIDAVLRDRFVQFIPLATDFSNREGQLLRQYGAALAALNGHR